MTPRQTPPDNAARRFDAWRDVDSERPVVGLMLSKFVVSIYLGKRLYRIARYR